MPNGSGYSIKLGNDIAGTEAEGISYEFIIPANRNEYSLIYHYAVVFQDPFHRPEEQPRFEVEITNVSDNSLIYCSSFTFYAAGSLLPGFYLSPNPPDNTPVWCKDWSAVSINLDGLAGKAIKLFFKTADCTFRRHFGYAYIDVNSECSSEFVGATYCRADTTIKIEAPFGYQQYTWFNNNFTQVLGTEQNLYLNPPPATGTTIAVEVVPYNGYGCLDTLYALLIDTLKLKAIAGRDTFSCNGDLVPMGAIPKPGITYSWSPEAGLSNPAIANPLANPDTTTSYILTVRSFGGGCVNSDTVVVSTAFINNSMQVIGSTAYCEGSSDSTLLIVLPADSIQWYKNNIAISGATQRIYRVIQSGSYYATLFAKEGCIKTTETQNVIREKSRPGIRYSLEYAVINYPISLEARNFGASVLWTPATNLDNPTSLTPVFKGLTDQLYIIKITTAAGCITIDTQLVKTVQNVEMYVPTAFTPNNDGKNDFLRPVLMGIKELRYFKIFNRWGKVIYESRKAQPGWNGTINGIAQQSQVVVWIIEGLGVDGIIHRKKGSTILIR